MQKDAVIPMIIDMANKGYLSYDPETEWVESTPRLRQHILNSAGKQDYDVLQFNSNSDSMNATVNLLNYDLAIMGVSRIVMSDSQDVKIYPSDKLVTVKKGRDFTFGGSVQAGKLQYYGKEYYFHYDPFVIDLLNVDSVSFMADSFEKNEQGVHHLGAGEERAGAGHRNAWRSMRRATRAAFRSARAEWEDAGQVPGVPEVQQHQGELCVLRQEQHPARRVQQGQVLLPQ